MNSENQGQTILVEKRQLMLDGEAVIFPIKSTCSHPPAPKVKPSKWPRISSAKAKSNMRK